MGGTDILGCVDAGGCRCVRDAAGASTSKHARSIQANGPDRFYPTAAAADYYQYADWWMTALLQARAYRDGGAVPMTEDQRAADVAHFQYAISGHVADMQVHPHDTGWDTMWEGRYQQLIARFGS